MNVFKIVVGVNDFYVVAVSAEKAIIALHRKERFQEDLVTSITKVIYDVIMP